MKRILLICAVFCAACDTVEFQSPPSTLQACDPVLVGDWRVEDMRREPEAKEALYLRVEANCARWYSVGLEPDDAGKMKADVDDLAADMDLAFARTAKQTFIAARDRAKPGQTAAVDDKPEGYLLIAYGASEAAIYLQQVNVKAAAHLIVDGTIPGWVDKRDRRADGSRDAFSSRFWVYVFGSPEETEELLVQHELLDAPWMRLLPVDAATSANIDEWIRSTPIRSVRTSPDPRL